MSNQTVVPIPKVPAADLYHELARDMWRVRVLSPFGGRIALLVSIAVVAVLFWLWLLLKAELFPTTAETLPVKILGIVVGLSLGGIVGAVSAKWPRWSKAIIRFDLTLWIHGSRPTIEQLACVTRVREIIDSSPKKLVESESLRRWVRDYLWCPLLVLSHSNPATTRLDGGYSASRLPLKPQLAAYTWIHPDPGNPIANAWAVLSQVATRFVNEPDMLPTLDNMTRRWIFVVYCAKTGIDDQRMQEIGVQCRAMLEEGVAALSASKKVPKASQNLPIEVLYGIVVFSVTFMVAGGCWYYKGFSSIEEFMPLIGTITVVLPVSLWSAYHSRMKASAGVKQSSPPPAN